MSYLYLSDLKDAYRNDILTTLERENKTDLLEKITAGDDIVVGEYFTSSEYEIV